MRRQRNLLGWDDAVNPDPLLEVPRARDLDRVSQTRCSRASAKVCVPEMSRVTQAARGLLAGLCPGRSGLGWTSAGGVSWPGARAGLRGASAAPALCGLQERAMQEARPSGAGHRPKEQRLPPKGL